MLEILSEEAVPKLNLDVVAYAVTKKERDYILATGKSEYAH